MCSLLPEPPADETGSVTYFRSGRLVSDPADLARFARLLRRLAQQRGV